MHKPEIARITLAVLCALPVAANAQEGLKLKWQPSLTLVPISVGADVPLFIEADRLQGHNDRETEAAGDVRLRRLGQVMSTDRLRYDKPDNEITAEGNVRMENGPDVVEGARLKYRLDTDRGAMDTPSYTLHKSRDAGGERQIFRETDARGTAERILFEGPNQYRAQRTAYTACAPGNDDWYLRARELAIDKGRDVGVARDASIVFMGVPIFYSPYLSFSLHQARKSGLLAPHYGSTDKGGVELTVPYYWNIAPNRDATVSPRFMTKRGVLLLNDFRYLEPTYLGNARVEVLPNDNARHGEQRNAFFVRHNQEFPGGWSGTLNLQKVSDDTYFTDLSTQIATTSQVLLPREGTLGRIGAWGGTGTYSFNALAQRWQTLQADPLALLTPPYNRQPQLTLNATRPDTLQADFDFLGQYVGFDHPTQVNGRRVMAYPSMSLPLQTAYAHFTPKLGLNMTRYAIDANNQGYADESRTLPIFTADSALVFERPAAIGGTRFLQTLEPRLHYAYLPYRDQSRIPVFDSGLQDINLATLYAENQFAGWDRINDANQMTFGISSRLIEAESGSERLRGVVAQRYYFSTQRVTLPGTPARTSNSSDLLAALSGALAPRLTVDAGWQYNTTSSETRKFNVGARYQPQQGRVLNLGYRETLNVLKQTDFSTQWRFAQDWTALSRWNYSLRDNRTVEGLFGAEYNGGCWVLRLVAHRFATATQQASTTFFVQLELNGVSRIGSNPMETLKRNIGGYVKQDPRDPRPDEPRTPYYY